MKAMKKKLRKFLLMLSCGLLLMSLSVGVTVAYLTDTDEVNNTFTVGNVEITLDETVVVSREDEDGETMHGLIDPSNNPPQTHANIYHLIPGRTYDKNPTVHVASTSEDAYLFVKVVNGISGIEDQTDEGYTIAKQMEDKGWTLVKGQTDIYVYKNTVNAGEDIVVFETFKIAGNADVSRYATEENAASIVTIKACAVQAETLTAETAAPEAIALLNK